MPSTVIITMIAIGPHHQHDDDYDGSKEGSKGKPDRHQQEEKNERKHDIRGGGGGVTIL